MGVSSVVVMELGETGTWEMLFVIPGLSAFRGQNPESVRRLQTMPTDPGFGPADRPGMTNKRL
jgi:hypothetical protein